jgi:ankyrin repeat protein
MSASLPLRANLEWLRKTAKDRLEQLRVTDPAASLSDAQLSVARAYGFSSWRALKARVDELQAAIASLLIPRHELELASSVAPDDADLAALFDAIAKGAIEPVDGLLKRRPMLLRARGMQGQTALHVAAEHDDARLAAYLVARGADTDAKFGDSGHTPLSWAVTCHAFNFTRTMQKLGYGPDLFVAAGMGDLDAVHEKFDASGQPMPGASTTGSSRYAADGARLPCPPVSATEQISDALYIAARNGHVDVVRFLLTQSPDLAFRAYLGGTVLHWAYYSGSRDVIDLVIAAGADAEARDDEFKVRPRLFGACVLASWGFGRMLQPRLEQDPALVRMIDGTTALHEAARAGQAGTARLLLDAGADARALDRDGHRPAEVARLAGHTDLAAML